MFVFELFENAKQLTNGNLCVLKRIYNDFHWLTRALLHCYTVTLLHCYTVTLLHCYTVTLLHGTLKPLKVLNQFDFFSLISN